VTHTAFRVSYSLADGSLLLLKFPQVEVVQAGTLFIDQCDTVITVIREQIS